MIRFIPLGGAEEVGAGSYYLNIDGTGILLDCGSHPRKTGREALPDFSLLKDNPLDFVFISHAHHDHTGALPYLVKLFPHVRIFTTVQTKEIAGLTLHNAVRILEEKQSTEDNPAPFTHNEINLLIRSMNECDYRKEYQLRGLLQKPGTPLKVSFHEAGHILGSASILIEYSGYKIFYTGDINLSKQMLLNGAVLPGVKVDTLITECTYGAADSKNIPDWRAESARLAKELNNILNNDGAVLIPAFSLGKTQELLAVIHELIIKNKIMNVPVYTGGLANKISDLYDKHRYLVSRDYKNLKLKEIEQIDFYNITDLNEFKKKPGIVLASSGMLIERTRSYNLAKYWLNQKSFAIFIVGYMDPESPGYVVSNAERGKKIEYPGLIEKIKVSCSIIKFYFPSHSRHEDLVSLADKMKPGRVILIHGDDDARNRVGRTILDKYKNIKLHSAQTGKEIKII